jgi:purine nucleoside permease
LDFLFKSVLLLAVGIVEEIVPQDFSLRKTTAMRSHLLAALQLLSVASASLVPAAEVKQRAIEYVVKPKVFIISMFDPEAEVWYGIPEFDILGLNITVPGFSPLFPDAHCTADGDICQLVTGESGERGQSRQIVESKR